MCDCRDCGSWVDCGDPFCNNDICPTCAVENEVEADWGRDYGDEDEEDVNSPGFYGSDEEDE